MEIDLRSHVVAQKLVPCLRNSMHFVMVKMSRQKGPEIAHIDTDERAFRRLMAKFEKIAVDLQGEPLWL